LLTEVRKLSYTEEQERLIGLITDWGFYLYGEKHTLTGNEQVFVKDFKPTPSAAHSKITYPFIDRSRPYISHLSDAIMLIMSNCY